MQIPLVKDDGSILTALALEHYPALVEFFAYDLRKDLAVVLVQALVDKEIHLTTVEQVGTFLDITAPLIADQPDQPADEPVDEIDFSEEQTLVGRMVSMLDAESLDMQFQMLSLARKRLGGGGELRIKRTLPGICFKSLQLVRAYFDAGADSDEMWEKKMQKIYTFCHQTITALSKAEFSDLALKLFLQAALTADYTTFDKSESIAYEFMSQVCAVHRTVSSLHLGEDFAKSTHSTRIT